MRAALTRYRRPLFLAAAIVLAALACWAGYSFAFAADLMEWDCGGGGCATNDPRSLGMLVALLGTVGAVLLSGFAVGLIGPAVAIAASAFWFRRGIEDAIAAGHTQASTVGTPMTATTIAFIVAGLCVVGWVWMLVGRVRGRRLVAKHRAEQAAYHRPD